MKKINTGDLILARRKVKDRAFYMIEECIIVRQLNTHEYTPVYLVAFKTGTGCIRPVDIKDDKGNVIEVIWESFNVDAYRGTTLDINLTDAFTKTEYAFSMATQDRLYAV